MQFSFYNVVDNSVPYLNRYIKRPTISGPGIYDPTEVMNRANTTLFMREGFVKIGFYVVSFLFYLYK